MLSLTIVVLAAAAAGFIVWANDQRHAKDGAGVPAGPVSPLNPHSTGGP